MTLMNAKQEDLAKAREAIMKLIASKKKVAVASK